MISLDLGKCSSIKPDGAPFDLGEHLRLLYACCAMRGAFIGGMMRRVSVKAGKRCVLELYGVTYPEHIWDAAVREFQKHGNEVAV